MKTVLIVDDEYLIASILSLALEDEGFLTVKATSARHALEIIDREQPDLIITDFMMPGMTGLELAQQVRARPFYAATPILLMSGAQAHLAAEHPDLFEDVFDKPFEITTIIGRIKELLNA